jgi:hypothetical protein
MFRPAQLRNMGISLQTEFPTRSVIQEAWNDAYVEWKEYGNEELINSLGTRVTLEGTAAKEEELARTRKQLDAIVPANARREATLELLPMTALTEDEQEEYALLSKTDIDQLSNDQQQRFRKLSYALESMQDQLDQQVALKARPENKVEAVKLVNDIKLLRSELKVIGRDAFTVNYGYWAVRTKIEAEQRTADAQLALYEAREVWKQSIYEDEFDYDYRSRKKTVVRKGAISLYEEAFAQWQPIFEENPVLVDGQLSDRIGEHLQEYYRMLKFTNRDWPKDFPLQALIDERFKNGDDDGIPTTESMQDFEEEDSTAAEENGSNSQPENTEGDAEG